MSETTHERSIPQTPLAMVEVSRTEGGCKQGDRVRIKKGQYKGKLGEIQTIGHAPDGTPLYLVTVTIKVVYERDQIERIESEVHNG